MADGLVHSIPEIVTDCNVEHALKTLGECDPETSENWPKDIYQILSVVFMPDNRPRVTSCMGGRPSKQQVIFLIEHLAHQYNIRLRHLIRAGLFDYGCDSEAEAHREGYVYLIECEQGQFYKIGRTNDLQRRFDQFGVQLPFKVSIRHAIKVHDMACAELALHDKFTSFRTNGEWFNLPIEEVDWFCQITDYAINNERLSLGKSLQ